MPANRRLSPERAELLARLVADGVSVRRMQTLYGFNRLTVLRHYPELHTTRTYSRGDEASRAGNGG